MGLLAEGTVQTAPRAELDPAFTYKIDQIHEPQGDRDVKDTCSFTQSVARRLFKTTVTLKMTPDSMLTLSVQDAAMASSTHPSSGTHHGNGSNEAAISASPELQSLSKVRSHLRQFLDTSQAVQPPTGHSQVLLCCESIIVCIHM